MATDRTAQVHAYAEASEVEEILTMWSVPYALTEPANEDDGYRLTVDACTARFATLEDGTVWATTDDASPADAYDGPANAAALAVHLAEYAPVPTAAADVAVAILNATEGEADLSYNSIVGYLTVETPHTTIEIDPFGDWYVSSSYVEIDFSQYRTRDVAAVIRAGDMHFSMTREAITEVLYGGDYADDSWDYIVSSLSKCDVTTLGRLSRVDGPVGCSHAGFLVEELRDSDGGKCWRVVNLENVTSDTETDERDLAAGILSAFA